MEDIMIQLSIAGFSLVALLHTLGLILLCKLRWELPNQQILSLNLVVVELVHAYYVIIVDSILLSGIEYPDQFFLVFTFIGTLLSTEIRLAVLHIIMDRFLEIYLNVKYPIYMPEKRMKIIVASLWCLCAVLASVVVICMKI